MTLLIKNVQIVGGAKEFPEPRDIFVSDDKISAIGVFPNKRADIVLDGQGAYLSPGFIDVNTDSDHYLTLFDYPSQEDFLRQGVTTIFGGMCGSSLAPLAYGTLESIQKWGDTNRVNVNWHSLAELLRVLDRRPLAVNFGTLVGHSTIRRAIVGEALRDLTKNELGVFARILETSLKEGAFGFSTGLAYVHSHKTSYFELSFFADIVRRFHGVYATHLRDAALGIKESIDETIKLTKEAGVRTLVSHFVPILGAEQPYEAALTAMNELPEEVAMRFDIYPSSSSLMPIYTFLPKWAQNGGVAVMLANVKDEWLLARVRKDMAALDEEHFIIAQAPGSDFLVGKSLRDIRNMYELKEARDALLKLMAATNMKGTIIYQNLNHALALKAIESKRSFIASNAASFDDTGKYKQLKSERTTATFTRFLSLAEQEKIMPFDEAIRKITIEPAKMFDLAGRGEIKEGNFADLVCFKGEEVRFTIVNGVVVYAGGEFQKKFPGKVLRHVVKK
jgi:N-acyl-D-aspartate/D-glutamate deacylase